MFGTRRPAPREEVVKGELTQSLDHLKQAADHAAVGIDAAVTPRIHALRGYLSPAAARLKNATSNGWGSAMIAFAPLAAAAAEGVRQTDTAVRKARSLQMRNGMMMQGLLSMMGMRNRTMMPGMPMMKSLRNMTGMG
ncbi:MAG TPA: hypothetical protein VFX61_19400, partial [Micromonosporaceae bacterium]|nr:hypothetical protein [Micromonosporaceae bacterium]